MKWFERLAPRLRSIGLSLALAGLLAAPLVGRAAPPAQQTGLTLDARIGFDGYYKDSLWAPVRIQVENQGADSAGQIQIVNPRGYGSVETTFLRSVELPTQSRRELQMYIAPEGYAGTLDVRLLNPSGNQVLAMAQVRLTQLTTNDLLYGVVAGAPSAFSVLTDLDPISGQAYLAQLELADLPAAAAAWQALDVLVISDVDTGPLSPEQRASLADWVRMGGRLMVMGGPGWQKTAAGLSDLLPLVPTAAQTAPDLAGLLTFVGATSALREGAVVATGALTADASVLAQTAAGVPLLVARREGFGQVVYFAADAGFAPLSGWPGTVNLFRRVLSTPLDRPSWAFGISNWPTASAAINAIPSLELPNPLLICGFLGLYLVLVGPLNYLVLRYFKRRELAWVTIPLIVCAFSLVAYGLGFFLVGGQAILHQLTVVQVWPGASQARVEQAVGVFSPQRTSYTVAFAPGVLARPLPGGGGTVPVTLQAAQGEQTVISGVRSDIGSVQGFAVQGSMPAPKFDAQLQIAQTGGSYTVSGTISNQSDLTLRDAVVLAPGGAYALGVFAPGETKTVTFALTASRASAAPPNTIEPFSPASGVAPGAPPYYGSYSSYDTTIDDILGTSNYYQDREAYRRYQLLSAVINVYGGAGGLGRGTGVYLAGWTDQAPISAQLLETGFGTANATVYLVALPPWTTTGASLLPPAMFVWSPATAGGGDPHAGQAPYDLTLYTREAYAVRFTPSVTAHGPWAALWLNVFGSSYGASATTAPEVALKDFTTGDWVVLDVTGYGTHAVPDPERFRGPGDVVEVRLRNLTSDTINLTQVDVSLGLEP